jgi:hypothetical protein
MPGKLVITANLTAEEAEDLHQHLAKLNGTRALDVFHFGGLKLHLRQVSFEVLTPGAPEILNIDAIAVVNEDECRTHSTPVITPVTP